MTNIRAMRTTEEIERQFLGERSGWDQSSLQKLIDHTVEERFDLDYKRAALLGPNSKDDITKVVSAMANSAGGVVIFGIAEHEDKRLRHYPERIDPVQRSKFGRERLDQMISQIQPVVDGLRIYPVPINDSVEDVVYVVVVPQSATAHQATDLKYYYRSNDRSEPMRDYQIRDVMNRLQHPKIVLDIPIYQYEDDYGKSIPRSSRYYMNVQAVNIGSRMAKYVACSIWVPVALKPVTKGESSYIVKHREYGGAYHIFDVRNRRQKAAIYEPVHPGRVLTLRRIQIEGHLVERGLGDVDVHWEASADNAPVERGTAKLSVLVRMN